MTKAVEVAEKIRSMDTWDAQLCAELCELAGMSEEWKDANGDTFERVLYSAAEKLGVEII